MPGGDLRERLVQPLAIERERRRERPRGQRGRRSPAGSAAAARELLRSSDTFVSLGGASDGDASDGGSKHADAYPAGAGWGPGECACSCVRGLRGLLGLAPSDDPRRSPCGQRRVSERDASPARADAARARHGVEASRSLQRGLGASASAPALGAVDVCEEGLHARYALLDVIGVGASATCYRCERVLHGSLPGGLATVFAAKAISKAGASRSALCALRREAVLLRAASHPNLVRLEAAFECEQRLTLVLQLCEGGELLQLLLGRPEHKLAEAEAARVLCQLGGALAHLHGLGVAHRDVKPDNVLLSQQGCVAAVKLCDLGSAATLHAGAAGAGALRWAERPRGGAEGGAGAAAQREHDGRWASFAPPSPSDWPDAAAPAGTPGYLAPELRSGSTWGSGVDVWALGVLAHLCLSGSLPFCPGEGHRPADARARAPADARLTPRICPPPAVLSPCPPLCAERDALPLSLDEGAAAAEYALQLTGGPWEAVSAEGRRAVAAMLRVRPELRPTAQQVAESPWARSAAGAADADGSEPPCRAGAAEDGLSALAAHAAGSSGRYAPPTPADRSREQSAGSTPSAASTEMRRPLHDDEPPDARCSHSRAHPLPAGHTLGAAARGDGHRSSPWPWERWLR